MQGLAIAMPIEGEFLKLLIDIAKADAGIKAVYMNGSRTNVYAPKDLFQDYDIVYVVQETKSFIEDKGWIDRFGQRLYMQYPDDGIWYKPEVDQCYGWLIQLADGVRLDLHVQTVERSRHDLLNDSLCIILLDKDDILPKILPPSDKSYWVQRPTKAEFHACCNEFWWCLNNVGKGLWRCEVPYVQDMVNDILRPQLVKILSWKIGIDNDFKVSIGKSGKYMHRFLTATEWNAFLQTYSNGEIELMWKAYKIMCRLFDITAGYVGEMLEFSYNRSEAEASFNFFIKTKNLTSDAKNF